LGLVGLGGCIDNGSEMPPVGLDPCEPEEAEMARWPAAVSPDGGTGGEDVEAWREGAAVGTWGH
jgi:hypothetical protein